MTGPAARGSQGGRAITATLAGVVSGVAGVVMVRALLGPGVSPLAAVVGVVALLAAAGLSWAVTAPGRRTAPRLPGGRRRRPHIHPVAWFGPVVGSVVAVGAWAGVAHSSGSGWVQAVGALLAAVLLIGLVLPAWPAHRARVRCTASPSDTEAGRPTDYTLEANGPVRIRPRAPVGPAARAEGRSYGPRQVRITVTPDRRAVLDSVVVEVASCAPFGLLWWAKDVEVALTRPLHVAPRTAGTGPTGSVVDDSAGQAATRVPAGMGEPRGIRPYRPGDSRRSVHWPASAHTGTLMVRETERQTDDPVVVDVVLPPDPVEAELVTERVMATVSQELDRRRPVLLVTEESDGPVRRAVRDRIDLGRRLARAVPPPLPARPDGGGRPRRTRAGRGRS